MKITFQQDWNGNRAGSTKSFPQHVAEALCTSPGPNGEPVAVPFVDIERLSVAELKQRLRQAGLKVTGRKAELVARLRGAR